MRTDDYIFSVATGASVTPEKRIPGKKKKMKSFAMLPQINDLITNQGINMLGTEKDLILHHN